MPLEIGLAWTEVQECPKLGTLSGYEMVHFTWCRIDFSVDSCAEKCQRLFKVIYKKEDGLAVVEP